MTDRYERREEEEEEDEIGEQDYKAQKDALIFAIDVSKSMLQPPPESDGKKADRDPAVYAALKSAYEVMQQRIISNPKDMMGIILFGTEKTRYRDDQNLQYPHCYVYADLDITAAEDVKHLKRLVEDGEDADEILVPSKEGVQMSNLLFLANNLLTTKAPNFGSRRLFIITDNDNPHGGDKEIRDAAAYRAKDLYDLGVSIELFAITRNHQNFDFSKFYDDIIYRDPSIEEAHPGHVTTSKGGDGLTLLGSLISNINSRQTPKRSYFNNMALELGPGFQISVKGYNIIQKQTPAPSCYVWLDGEQAQVAVGETARIAEDSARTVESGEVKKAYKFGGEFVYFGEDEQKSIKQFGNPIIRIVGFKDRSLLKFWVSIKKSIYIFPSEDGYVGSSRVFTALWQKLLKSKKIGIAWHIARTNGNPQLVAIIPSKAQSDGKSGTNFIPAGLWLYPIPYADDMRDGPETKVNRTTDALTDKMNFIVRQLQLPNASYNPSRYPNPALQWHYKILQTLALEEEVPDRPDDATIPKYRAIHKRCGGYIQEWSQMADDALGQLRDVKAIKREMEDGDEEDGPRPAKKSRTTAAKTSVNGGGTGNAELKKRSDDDTLSKLTVTELKTILGERGLDNKGLKKALVERLEEWVEENLGNHVCSSVQDLQGQLHNLLASKSSETRAEHASFTFELRYNTVFHLTADAENGPGDGSNSAQWQQQQQQQQAVTRTVNASETVQNQPADDPVLQKAVAKHIVGAMGIIDSSSWAVRSVSRGAQGWTFTYICKDSLQAWNRANAKNAEKPVIGSYSGPGGLDPINLSRPAFDCRGTLTVAFSKSSRGVIVKYKHTPLHKTVAQLVDLLAPSLPPAPVANGNIGNQRTPKAKRPPPAEGEDASRRKRPRRKGKAPEAPMGESMPLENGQNAAQNTPGSQIPAQDGEHLTSILNVPPVEAERRRVTAIDLLTGKGIDPATLSAEQFNIFANQAPHLQTTSLEMLAKYGAERLRIVHPDEKDPSGSTNSTPAQGQSASTTPATGPGASSTPGATETPTKPKRSRKKKPAEAIAQVSIGDGAVVAMEENGGVGTTASTLKPRTRKTRGSCETCRQRKAKCTKEHPSCTVCIEAGADCVYLPPKPRRKSEKLPEAVEQEDSDVPGESERFHAQYDPEAAASIPPPPSAPAPVQPPVAATAPPPPDPDNEEFIPDPNILSTHVEHQPTVTQPSASHYYQGNTPGLTYPQNPQLPSGNTIHNLTYPQSQPHEAHSQSSILAFPSATHQSTSHQAEHSPRLAYPEPASTSSQKRQSSSTSSRRSLPTKQTPVPPPSLPANTSAWTTSPTTGHATTGSPTLAQQQVGKRPKPQKSIPEATQQAHDGIKQAAALSQAATHSPSQQSPVTRSPFQNSVRVKSRQGHRSQTSTPVTAISHPPPQTPQTTTSAPYNTNSISSSVPNYDPYSRYNASNNDQYTGGSSFSNNPTTTTSASYSSAPSYDYTRSTSSSNPLSQALKPASGYSSTNNSTPSQWPTSQARTSQSHAAHPYSAYGTRTADSRGTTQTPSYSHHQSQSYGSYSSQQPGTTQPSTAPPNQNCYNSNRNSGYGAATSSSHASSYNSHRTNVPGYSGHGYGSGDDQTIYDLLRANGSTS
ncbi:hypothetical protein F5B20DRAFT_574617 [Whalleya microplaca]|nr:hypothetical protein F5B20DRAFT_574617 [Whalleya microplaca]